MCSSDLLDTILSIYFGNFDDGMPYAVNLAAITHWWRLYRRIMQHWEQRFPGAIFALDYERLVSDTDATMAELGAFLGASPVSRETAMLAPHRPIRTLSSWQVREPVHARSVWRWENYRTQLAPIMAMVKEAQ